ncbi:tetratricopeptide repeat protein [Polynucleobacter sp. MG-27-Goln-C1]|uniref:O-linked N-acetylglucosamine transferase family protein n=1 Tax=Polynucleobacter sp. MG-27-Goln-C1 TaxID=1819726 RepID=UPI001C0DCF33|nr:tetratricopeptide repeat protein [Polynucleobacter sp. MG-27-Goln-C1]MBU3612664.1 tetratricopeptide repeat protein [Polynucleobacter sp. MG-27-Goln-C1]
MNTQIAYLLGLASDYIQKGDTSSADRLLKQAQKMSPKNSEICRLLGVTSAFKGDPEEALGWVDKAIKIDPKNWLAHSNRGNILSSLSQKQEAIKSFIKAIGLQPSYAEAHNNIGNVLLDLNRPEEALRSYEKAIQLQPNYAQAYDNLGHVLVKMKRLEEAFSAYEKAILFDSDSSNILSSYIDCKMQLCDWGGLEELIKRVPYVNQNKNTFKFMPFYLLSISDNQRFIKMITEEYVQARHPEKFTLGRICYSENKEKIRLGYFSPDFRNHPVSYLMAGVLESHDRDRFELIGFSMGTQAEDAMYKRLEPCFDQIIDISLKSDLEVAQLARQLQIDIAIDLCGFTQGCRPGIFAYRVAPVQIGYLGYVGTMGANYMDYIIADQTVIPANLQDCYSEKVIYLPSFQANDRKREISDKEFTREELGLPSEGFIFCCFNANYKITLSIFNSWVKILHAVQGSVLFLFVENKTAQNNLLDKLELNALDRGRIIFANAVPYPEYLARYRVADLFLDTSPYNAGTTASDALWAGLPVLTLAGESFSSRMGASLATAIGLPELIATSQEDYEAIAIDLGKNPDKIASIKKKLAENRLTTALFDTQFFTNNLESAYEKVNKRYQDGLPPDHIN